MNLFALTTAERHCSTSAVYKLRPLRHLAPRRPHTSKGRLKCTGRTVHTKGRFFTLYADKTASKATRMDCRDVFDSIVFFHCACWVGTREENPDEEPLPLPTSLEVRRRSVVLTVLYEPSQQYDGCKTCDRGKSVYQFQRHRVKMLIHSYLLQNSIPMVSVHPVRVRFSTCRVSTLRVVPILWSGEIAAFEHVDGGE